LAYCIAEKCPLKELVGTVIRTCGVEPWGVERPTLYILGEAPGSQEDFHGVPFIGPAGQLLRDCLRRMQIPDVMIRINNTVRCAPFNTKAGKIGRPAAPHIKACRPSVLRDIELAQPKVILTLGDIPTKALLTTTAGIMSIRGTVQQTTIGQQTYTVVPTIHPSYIRRQGNDVTLLTFFMHDIKLAWSLAQGGATSQSAQARYAKRDYAMLRSIDEVKAYVQECVQEVTTKGGYITADFEAAGLQANDPQLACLGLAVSYRAHQGRYIPMDHWQSPLSGQMTRLSEILAPLCNIPMANQNMKFDWQWWRHRLGLMPKQIVFDPMLAHHCIFTGSRPNDLETMGGLYLQEPSWSYRLIDKVKEARTYIDKEIRAAKKAKDEGAQQYWLRWRTIARQGAGYAVAPLEDLALYACIDSDVTWRLVPLIMKMLQEHGLYDVYKRHYQDAIVPFGDMQYDGVAIDNRVVAQLKEEIPSSMKLIEAEINSTKYAETTLQIMGKDPTKESVNLGSPQQMATLIYDVMKMPPARIPNKPPRTTEADQLEQLLGWTRRNNKKRPHAVLSKLSDWRTLQRYLGTYVESNLKYQDRFGLVHPTWNVTGARTGRFSAQDPPIHSAPAQGNIRCQYVSRWAEQGGCLLGADESQVEVRVFASLANDVNLIRFYCEMAGADLHRYMASLLFDVPYEHVTTEERRIAKTCVFASLYGGGAGNLAGQTGMLKRDADIVHAKFLALVAVEQFKAQKSQELFKFGYVSTPFGRRSIINIGNTQTSERHAIRQAMNTPIQSTASDIVELAIIRARQYMDEMGLKSKLIIFHHDAIYWDVFPGELFKLVHLAQRVMVEEPMAMYPWLRVPLKIGIEFGKSWGDKIEIDHFEGEKLHIHFEARSDEESCYDRYYKKVASQFEGPLGQVLQLQNLDWSPREIHAVVTPRAG